MVVVGGESVPLVSLGWLLDADAADAVIHLLVAGRCLWCSVVLLRVVLVLVLHWGGGGRRSGFMRGEEVVFDGCGLCHRGLRFVPLVLFKKWSFWARIHFVLRTDSCICK